MPGLPAFRFLLLAATLAGVPCAPVLAQGFSMGPSEALSQPLPGRPRQATPRAQPAARAPRRATRAPSVPAPSLPRQAVPPQP